ncbi:hypothetical protein BXO88_15160 [Oribacterium sp. C9]|uniref:ATP-binding protein n=1 Tax=Oribacterium sp. C9 TaxID=1943579 RepID=UPI0009CDC90E|nr:ATP-binding protein [Oribacterium sp. C9]OON84864.1 hypothetical protein BXO88_15160 [Oribacterium sp. C9]
MKKNELITEQMMSEMTIRYLTSPFFVIPTKGILDTEVKIKTWITLGACGGIIYGRPRIGKTRCLYHIAKTLTSDEYGNLPVIIWNLTDHAETEKNFYSTLLMAMGYECPKSTTALFIKERVINTLIVMACETPFRRVVLLIDEAWKFYEKDFAWLMDLYNNLIALDIQLYAFMFGTRELKDLKISFKQRGKDQIIGRFMINEIRYSGINSEKELSFCLASMDKLKMVTDGYKKLDKSLLDFYFPNAYGKSFYDLSAAYYEAFMKIRGNHGIASADIPMKYFIDSFIICLNLYGIYGSKAVAFPGAEELTECIEMSGYGESDDEYSRKNAG